MRYWLASLVGEVQNELAQIWSILGILNRFLGNAETGIINFSMEKARDAAWAFAEELSPLPGEQRHKAIAEKDTLFAQFSGIIMHPGFVSSVINKIIRLGERGKVRERIEILE